MLKWINSFISAVLKYAPYIEYDSQHVTYIVMLNVLMPYPLAIVESHHQLTNLWLHITHILSFIIRSRDYIIQGTILMLTLDFAEEVFKT